MDGPTIPWTVGDIAKLGGNKTFVCYHVMGSGYDYLTPLGCAIGVTILPRTSKFSSYTTLQAAGIGGMAAGALGMGLGLSAMINTSFKKDLAIPWTDDGIQMRVDGISNNFRVRALDLGVWVGVVAAGAALTVAGGPTKLGLSSGALGGFQAVALGSGLGSVSAITYLKLKDQAEIM